MDRDRGEDGGNKQLECASSWAHYQHQLEV